MLLWITFLITFIISIAGLAIELRRKNSSFNTAKTLTINDLYKLDNLTFWKTIETLMRCVLKFSSQLTFAKFFYHSRFRSESNLLIPFFFNCMLPRSTVAAITKINSDSPSSLKLRTMNNVGPYPEK